jgi:OOP family OmpA-OmpF porin
MVGSIASVVASPRVADTQTNDVRVNTGAVTQIEYPVENKQTEAEVVAAAQKNEIAQAEALKAEEAKVLAAVSSEVAPGAVDNAAGNNAAQKASDLLTQAIKAADEAKAQMMIAQKELRGEMKASLNLKRAQAVSEKKTQITSNMPKQAKAAEGTDAAIEAELARNAVHFNWMKSTLDDDSQVKLAKIARTMEKNPNLDIQIVGHTDNNGKPELNKWLGLIRARRVREQLVAQGISPKRLSVSSEGANSPVDTNDTPLGRWKNRRVEFALSAK